MVVNDLQLLQCLNLQQCNIIKGCSAMLHPLYLYPGSGLFCPLSIDKLIEFQGVFLYRVIILQCTMGSKSYSNL